MGSYTPEQTSTLFLAIFFLMVMAGGAGIITAFWRLYAPAKKKQMDALTAKHEADAKLAESLVVTTAKQTDLTERLVDMSNDHSQTLNIHGQILNVHSEQLRNITEAVGAKRASFSMATESQRPTVTIQSAVEVDSEGQARPVVVATEVIHSKPEKQP